MSFQKERKDRLSFSQENLVNDIVGITYGAHNAYEDVKSLRTLVDIVADLVSKLQVYLRDNILDMVKRNQYDGTFTGQSRFEQGPH